MRNKLIMLGLAALIGVVPLLTLPDANAKASEPGCVTDSGLWLFHGTRRTICDTPRRADGSWTRLREFWTPAHQVPMTCNTYGSRNYSSTNCSGGYFAPETSNGVENYPVTDATVLGDEPGWIAP